MAFWLFMQESFWTQPGRNVPLVTTWCLCGSAGLIGRVVLQGENVLRHGHPSVELPLGAQASLRLKNFASLNLTDLLPSGVTFTDPMFFRNAASNVTSAASVLLLYAALFLTS